MHPVQEQVNTQGIDCLIQRMKGTVFQPRVLQLNLDNIKFKCLCQVYCGVREVPHDCPTLSI